MPLNLQYVRSPGRPVVPASRAPTLGASLAPYVPQPAPVRTRRPRRKSLIALIVTVILLAAGVGGYAAFGAQARALLTARDFCMAIQAQQYAKAYTFFSGDLQRQVPRDAFLNISTRGDTLDGPVISCSASGIDMGAGGQTAVIHATLTRGLKGQSPANLTLSLENGDWKISEPPDPLLLPLTTAYFFCQDLQQQNYSAAFQLLSLDTQTKVGNSLLFQGIFTASHILTGSLKDCQATNVALSSDQRSLTVQSTLVFEHFPSLSAQLSESEESPDHWSVDTLTLSVLGIALHVPPGS